MRLCRFSLLNSDQAQLGRIEDDRVFPFPQGETIGSLTQPLASEGAPLHDIRLWTPVTPSKIVCVGRNYLEHAAELGNKMPDEPLLFLKAPSSLIAHREAIVLPPQSQQVEHEGELGVVIGRKARNIGSDEDPLKFVFGYTCLNDVTARDLQRKDGQFTRAKSFDTFCPVGPLIETELNPLDVAVTTRLNGAIKQSARTAVMAFSVPFLIRYIAAIMTLEPGDLIATGTPAGVSKMNDGDTVEVEIEGIGVLRNSVRSTNSEA